MRNSHPLVQSNPTLSELASDLAQSAEAALDRQSIPLLRRSIGVVFLWFGVLKFFTGMSPAEDIAVLTLQKLTLGLVPAQLLLVGLAGFEVTIGACFVAGLAPRLALPLLLLHMCGTALPLLMFPSMTFTHLPFVPSFLGQYILKNMIIVSAGLVLLRRWR
jgi:uncharacterized membrane protein YphA (DoxX/SURF4 family)